MIIEVGYENIALRADGKAGNPVLNLCPAQELGIDRDHHRAQRHHQRSDGRRQQNSDGRQDAGGQGVTERVKKSGIYVDNYRLASRLPEKSRSAGRTVKVALE